MNSVRVSIFLYRIILQYSAGWQYKHYSPMIFLLYRPMTPHSVGGSLNELGEARGTVLAVKLDRQMGRGITNLAGTFVRWYIFQSIIFGYHMVSMSILEIVVVCDPFKCFLYGGWPQTIKLGHFESPRIFIWAVHIATRIFRLGLCRFIWHHDSCITPLSRKVQELWVFFYIK